MNTDTQSKPPPQGPTETAPRQPAWVAQHDHALLKLPFVEALTGLSGSSLYRKIAAGQFPAPIRLGSRCSRWRAADINGWLRRLGGGAP